MVSALFRPMMTTTGSSKPIQNHFTIEKNGVVMTDQHTTAAAVIVMQDPIQDDFQPSTFPTTSAKRLCSGKEITRGQWEPITLPRPPYIPMSPRVRCLSQSEFSKPFSTWQWLPDPAQGCVMATLDRQDFLRRLVNTTVAFIGDSLTLEHYASLVHLLGDRARLPPRAVQHGRIRRRICAPLRNHTTYRHDPSFQPYNECMDLIFKTDFYLENITQEVVESKPSVLVLNRGAHYTPDEDLVTSLRQYTLPALKQWDYKCSTSRTRCLLIWRTTVPGHPFCEKFTSPARSVEEMERWIHVMSNKDEGGGYRKGEYHWQDFQRQNQLVVSHLLQDEWRSLLPHIDIQIMDSYQPNVLRPDSHRSHMGDCLHSCSPGGGSDLNSHWLYHILLRHQERKNGI